MEMKSEGRTSLGNTTMTSDSANITGHTSQIQAISQLGNDPDQWLLALRSLEELEDGPRKHKLLKHFFVQSGKILDSALLRKSRSYAVLLGKEALFYGKIDADDARDAFQMGLSMCPNAAVLYVMFAQFELDKGRKDKALKLLKRGQVCVENQREITAAKAKLDQGFARIDGSKPKPDSLPLKNITNEVKTCILPNGNAKNSVAASYKKVAAFETQNTNGPNPVRPYGNLNVSSPITSSRSVSSISAHARASLQPNSSHLQSHRSVPNRDNTDNISNANCITPPPNRITELMKSCQLGLMDSPASPNVTFEFATQLKPGESSNPATSTQHVSSHLARLPDSKNTISKSVLAPPAHAALSERKDSPFCRQMPQRCQTTGKKPVRVPMSSPPRRVLIKGAATNLSESDSEDDIKPIQESSDDLKVSVKPENRYESEGGSAQVKQASHKMPINNDKEQGASRLSSLSLENAPAKASQKKSPLGIAGAFKPYSTPNLQSNPTQPPTSCEDPATKSVVRSQFKKPDLRNDIANHSALAGKENAAPHCSRQPSSLSLSAIADKENATPCSTLAQQSHLEPVRSSGMCSNNPGDSGLGNSRVFVQSSVQTNFDNHSVTQQRDALSIVHPIHKLIMEKPIIEVNGHPYILFKLLGKGGSSKVYQVLDLKTSMVAAIKQVNLTGCESSVLKGYKNEINFLKKLQGNHYIIKLIDYEIKEQCLYLVMECGSLDLSAYLKKQKLLGESLEFIDILVIWKNMLRAVETIHKHGIIHLDLKPANFMFVDSALKLIDFGIANSIEVDATSVIKDTQFGTLNYMAPETINDMSEAQTGPKYEPKFKVGPKADVWSLGCILYYIMYGKTPFQHIHHQMKKLFAITNENHRIDFPNFPRKELVEIVQACLTRDPKKRPSVEMLLNHPLLK